MWQEELAPSRTVHSSQSHPKFHTRSLPPVLECTSMWTKALQSDLTAAQSKPESTISVSFPFSRQCIKMCQEVNLETMNPAIFFRWQFHKWTWTKTCQHWFGREDCQSLLLPQYVYTSSLALLSSYCSPPPQYLHQLPFLTPFSCCRKSHKKSFTVARPTNKFLPVH